MTEGVLTASSRLGHPSFNQVPCTPGLPSPHDKLQFIEILSRRHPTFRHFQFTNFPSRKIKLCGQRLYFGTELTRDHNSSLFTIHYSLKSHGSGFLSFNQVPCTPGIAVAMRLNQKFSVRSRREYIAQPDMNTRKFIG